MFSSPGSETQAFERAAFQNQRVRGAHPSQFLGNRAPDMAFCSPMINNPNAIYAKALVEFRHPDTPIFGEALGQAYHYLLRLADAQLNRSTFTILVSNIHNNESITIVRDYGGFTVSHHGSVGFPEALAHLHIVLENPVQQLDNPSFTHSVGAVINVLGVTFSNLVAEFEFSEASLNRAVEAPSLVYVSTHRTLLPYCGKPWPRR